MLSHILFDIGETLLEADASQAALVDAHIKVLADAGQQLSPSEYEALERAVMLTFVPSPMHAITWHCCKPDVVLFDAVTQELRTHYQAIRQHPASLYPGVTDLLEELSSSYVLALAGNAPSSIRETLQELGVLRYFTHTDVSGDLPYKKPDQRFFETMLSRAGAEPHEAVLVGDRLDNDMIPAKRMDIRTIWVRHGRYSVLEPRTPAEIPDVTVESVTQVRNALAALEQQIGES